MATKKADKLEFLRSHKIAPMVENLLEYVLEHTDQDHLLATATWAAAQLRKHSPALWDSFIQNTLMTPHQKKVDITPAPTDDNKGGQQQQQLQQQLQQQPNQHDGHDSHDKEAPTELHHITKPQEKEHTNHPHKKKQASGVAKRLASGIRQPKTADEGVTRFYEEGYIPKVTVVEAIMAVPDEYLPKQFVKQMLEDMKEVNLRSRLDMARSSLPGFEAVTMADAEAVFIYTYELVENRDVTLMEMDEDVLIENLKELKAEFLDAAPDVLKAIKTHKITGSQFMKGECDALLDVPVDLNLWTCEELHLDNDLESWETAKSLHSMIEPGLNQNALQHGLDELRALLKQHRTRQRRSLDKQIYAQMNTAMRNGDEGGIKIWRDVIWHVEQALTKVPNTAMKSYRGINVTLHVDTYKIGSKYIWPAFSSTSILQSVGMDFMDGATDTGTLFVINCTKGKEIQHFSMFPEESEYLLAPNSVFKVRAALASDQLTFTSNQQIMVLNQIDSIDDIGLQTFTSGSIDLPKELKFQGEVATTPHGIGSITGPDGYMYKGEMDHGLKDGYGMEVRGAERYEGMWKQDLRHGKGKHKWASGDTYEGNFRDGVRHGEGVFTGVYGIHYEGTWSCNKRDGIGHETYNVASNHSVSYKGGFRANCYHGYGEYVWRRPDGLYTYKGGFRWNNYHARGTIVFPDGRQLKGTFDNGALKHAAFLYGPLHDLIEERFYEPTPPETHWGGKEEFQVGYRKITITNAEEELGYGTVTWGEFTKAGTNDGTYYEGEFKKTRCHGKGKLHRVINGNPVDTYEGEFEDDRRHGYGVRKWHMGGSTTAGQYKRGLLHGPVRVTVSAEKWGKYFPNGLDIEGTFVDGECIQHCDGYDDDGEPHGLGVGLSASEVYKGHYKHGWWHGEGMCIKFETGVVSTGTFVDGYQVLGRQEHLDGTVYKGRFDNSTGKAKYHGEGKKTYPNGDVFEGIFAHGERTGPGVLKDKNGEIIQEGMWICDEFYGNV